VNFTALNRKGYLVGQVEEMNQAAADNPGSHGKRRPLTDVNTHQSADDVFHTNMGQPLAA